MQKMGKSVHVIVMYPSHVFYINDYYDIDQAIQPKQFFYSTL